MRIIAAIAVVTLIAAIAQPASAGMAEDCVQSDDRDLQIGGCTAVIRSGEYSGTNLAAAYNNRGTAYDELGEYRRAIQDYDQALRINPGHAKAYYNRGVAYDNLGEYRRAIEDYDQVLRINPSYGSAYQNRGVSYENLGEFQRAAEEWERAIRIDGASRARWWQKYMRGKGHYAGAIDGVFGPATRRGLVACAYDPAC